MKEKELISRINSSLNHAFCLIGSKESFNDFLKKFLTQSQIPETEVWRAVKTPLSIDEARNLKKWLFLSRSAENNRKIAVVPLEKIQIEAANALLKMFEEPPPYTVIIAHSSSKPAVAPTIASRMQFYRLPTTAKKKLAKDIPPSKPQKLLEELLAVSSGIKNKNPSAELDRIINEVRSCNTDDDLLYKKLEKLLEYKKYSKQNTNKKLLLENAVLIKHLEEINNEF